MKQTLSATPDSKKPIQREDEEKSFLQKTGEVYDNKGIFWEKAKELFSKKEFRQQIGKTTALTAASIAGLRSLYDIPSYLYQRFQVRGAMGVGGMEESIEDLINKDRLTTEEREEKTETDDRFKTRNAIKVLNKKLKLTKEGTQKGSDQRKKIAELLKADRKAKREFKQGKKEVEEGMYEEGEKQNIIAQLLQEQAELKELRDESRAGEIKEILDDYTETKVTGVQAIKESVNTALVATGAFKLRGLSYGVIDGFARYQKLSKEERKKGEEVKDVKVWEDVIKRAVKEAWDEARFKDPEGKKNTLQKGLTAVKAYGMAMRYFGITVSASTGTMTENIDKLNNALEGKTNLGDVGNNFVSNINRFVPEGSVMSEAQADTPATMAELVVPSDWASLGGYLMGQDHDRVVITITHKVSTDQYSNDELRKLKSEAAADLKYLLGTTFNDNVNKEMAEKSKLHINDLIRIINEKLSAATNNGAENVPGTREPEDTPADRPEDIITTPKEKVLPITHAPDATPRQLIDVEYRIPDGQELQYEYAVGARGILAGRHIQGKDVGYFITEDKWNGFTAKIIPGGEQSYFDAQVINNKEYYIHLDSENSDIADNYEYYAFEGGKLIRQTDPTELAPEATNEYVNGTTSGLHDVIPSKARIISKDFFTNDLEGKIANYKNNTSDFNNAFTSLSDNYGIMSNYEKFENARKFIKKIGDTGEYSTNAIEATINNLKSLLSFPNIATKMEADFLAAKNILQEIQDDMMKMAKGEGQYNDATLEADQDTLGAHLSADDFDGFFGEYNRALATNGTPTFELIDTNILQTIRQIITELEGMDNRTELDDQNYAKLKEILRRYSEGRRENGFKDEEATDETENKRGKSRGWPAPESRSRDYDHIITFGPDSMSNAAIQPYTAANSPEANLGEHSQDNPENINHTENPSLKKASESVAVQPDNRLTAEQSNIISGLQDFKERAANIYKGIIAEEDREKLNKLLDVVSDMLDEYESKFDEAGVNINKFLTEEYLELQELYHKIAEQLGYGTEEDLPKVEVAGEETTSVDEPTSESKPEYIHKVQKGDTVWSMITAQLEKKPGFSELSKGQQLYVIDRIEDDLAKMTKADVIKILGIKSGDIGKIEVGESVDLTSVIKLEDKSLQEASELKEETIKKIEAATTPSKK